MVTASLFRPTWASVATYVMLLMLTTLCRIAMTTTQLFFYDDPESTHLWTNGSTEFGGAPLKEAGKEPGTLRVGHCNVNGLLTDVRSKDQLKCAGVREFMTGSADLIPHEVLCINEVSKSATCSAEERCMIGRHVNPGRGPRITEAAYGVDAPDQKDGVGWNNRVDQLTSDIQELYLVHKLEWQGRRSQAVRAACRRLERHDTKGLTLDTHSSDYYVARRAKYRI
jgi:hypothetical protein